ncbi:hypothetical protein ACONDI_02068 [Natranaerofaba carboxydovora]|nr:hypothetical protein ACONDI_02068 [Natranaerofaba carboxydovora]
MSFLIIGEKNDFYEQVVNYITKNYIDEKICQCSFNEISQLLWNEFQTTNVFFVTLRLDDKILDKVSYLKRLDSELSIFVIYNSYEVKGQSDQNYYLLSKIDALLKAPEESELVHQMELILKEKKFRKNNKTEHSFKSSLLKGELNIKEDFFAKKEFGDKVLEQTKELPIKVTLPDTFKNLLEKFYKLLTEAVRKRIYQEKSNGDFEISKEINKMARELYHLMALPKDILDIYTEALRKLNKSMLEHNIKIYIDEGRILVIEILGYLMLYYRMLYVI